MAGDTKSETCVQIALTGAAVQAVLADAPASLTLLTPGAAVQIAVRQKNFRDQNRLTNVPIVR